jgi:hypothetical protein
LEIDEAAAPADDIEKIAVIAGGGVGPFSCRALAEFSPAQPDE